MIIGSEDGSTVIGEDAVIRSGTVIYPQTRIGNRFRTGHNVLIREKTIIGDDVLIGTNSVVDGNCTIGSRVSIQTRVYITINTTLEDDVFMGPCSVTAVDSGMIRRYQSQQSLLDNAQQLGAPSNRPNGLFHMDMDYDCYFYDPSDGYNYFAFYWPMLDMSYGATGSGGDTTMVMVVGSTAPGATNWQPLGCGVYVDVDASLAGFINTPINTT